LISRKEKEKEKKKIEHVAQKRKRKRENPPQIHLIPHHPPLKSFIIQTILTPKILQPIIHDMGFHEKKKKKKFEKFSKFQDIPKRWSPFSLTYPSM